MLVSAKKVNGYVNEIMLRCSNEPNERVKMYIPHFAGKSDAEYSLKYRLFAYIFCYFLLDLRVVPTLMIETIIK